MNGDRETCVKCIQMVVDMLTSKVVTSEDKIIAFQKNIEGYSGQDVSQEIREAIFRIIESRNYTKINVIKVMISKVSNSEDV
jgi:hypothetical protein